MKKIIFFLTIMFLFLSITNLYGDGGNKYKNLNMLYNKLAQVKIIYRKIITINNQNFILTKVEIGKGTGKDTCLFVETERHIISVECNIR